MEAKRLKRVVIKEEIFAVTGDTISAIILGQFLYWQDRVRDFDKFIEEEKNRKAANGEILEVQLTNGWMYKTAKELIDECMLNISEVTARRYIQKLIDSNFIDCRKNPNNKWDRTLQYRVNLDFLINAIKEKDYDGLSDYRLQKEYMKLQNEDSYQKNEAAIPKTIYRDYNQREKENEDKSSFEKEYDFPSVAAEPMSEYGIKDWKKDFDEYKRLVEEAKEKLLSDEAFKQKMLKYYPNMDYELSIDKSITTYWGTEEGWNNKRAKRSKQINMLSTLKKNLDKSIVYKPKQNQAQAYKKETQEEYNMKLLRLPYEDKENGTLIDGTFVKGGYRYYHSQLNNKAVSCAMDAPERPDDRYEWDYRKNEWYLPYQLRTAADELW